MCNESIRKAAIALASVLAFTACGGDGPTGSDSGLAAEGSRYRMTQAGIINDAVVIYYATGPMTSQGFHEGGALNFWYYGNSAIATSDVDSVKVTYTVQTGTWQVEKISGRVDGTGSFAEWTQINSVSQHNLSAGQSVEIVARRP